MNTSKTVCWVVGIVALTVVGIIVIPPLLRKIENKMYKQSLKKDEIDYDNLGPEIVKKDNGEEDDA